MAHGLGFGVTLGPACRERDLVMAMLTARVANPTSKLATLSWFYGATLGADLGPVGTDDLYGAMEWLLARQSAIEKALARACLGPEANPDKYALFSLSSGKYGLRVRSVRVGGV